MNWPPLLNAVAIFALHVIAFGGVISQSVADTKTASDAPVQEAAEVMENKNATPSGSAEAQLPIDAEAEVKTETAAETPPDTSMAETDAAVESDGQLEEYEPAASPPVTPEGQASATQSGPAEETAVKPTNEWETATDRAIGNPEAKVTVIEYASVTCGACAQFHETTFKQIKADYIDTGKIRFILREFPTQPADRAKAGFLLARCVPEERYFGVIDVLFRRQEQWAFARDAYPELEAIAKSAGLSVQQFQDCLRDRDEIARIDAVQDKGNTDYGITGTPSFVINGKKHANMNYEAFKEVLDGLLEAN